MPDSDVIFKYFRIRGKDVCLVFVYFDTATGLAGENLRKMNKICELRNRGKMPLIVAGDFNMLENGTRISSTRTTWR